MKKPILKVIHTYLSNIIIILHVKSIEQKERETDYFSSFKMNINTYVKIKKGIFAKNYIHI